MKSLRQFLLMPLLLMLLAFAQNARPPELFPVHILRVARANIAEHRRESQLTGNNPAPLCYAESSLATGQRNFRGALAAVQLAIDIWSRSDGPRLVTLGAAYALRAQILDSIGDHPQAISDYESALSLLEESPVRDTRAYLSVQLAYCHSLHKVATKQEVARIEQPAKAELASVRIQQCSSCTMSAASFR